MSKLAIEEPSKRIRRPEEYNDLIEFLKKENIFTSFKNVLIFSASLGFRLNLREPFEKSGERIPLSIFDETVDVPFILCIALAEEGDISCLRSENFQNAKLIFEEYANGGLSFLDANLDRKNPKSSLESIISEYSMDTSAADLDISKLW